MADKHPYVSGSGVLIQVLTQLRKSFPQILDAAVLKKLGFAPNNESYIVNTIRFLGLIDEENKRKPEAQSIFTLHDDGAFQPAFADIVKKAYHGLFALHGEAAWGLADSKLITFFRQTDQSSDIVGSRQAKTFRGLAQYAGFDQEVGSSAKGSSAKPVSKLTAKAKAIKPTSKEKPSVEIGAGFVAPPVDPGSAGSSRNLGLTVRIEINLPPNGDQQTYDNIFKSIRENLINV